MTERLTENEVALLRSLECLNSEIIELCESGPFRLGRSLYRLRDLIKSRRFSTIVTELATRQKVRHWKKSHPTIYPFAPGDRGALGLALDSYSICDKAVVYSCITNGYDDPRDPVYCTSGVDYILFSDEQPPQNTKWIIRDISTVSIPTEGQSNVNRWFKMHPWALFEKDQQYDCALYIDGSVTIVSDISPLFQAAKQSRSGIALHRHSSSVSVQNEGDACIAMGKATASSVRQQISDYQSVGFPDTLGLWEATVIAVDMTNPVAKLLMDTWWDLFHTSKSGRDQLSFPLAVWALGLSADDVGCLGYDVSRNPKIRWGRHLVH